jgi:diguanylate cyclase (GGDEF)-like protein
MQKDTSPLEAENRALRRRLDTLLREARSNEDKQRRFDQLEHRLIAARGIVELLRLLLGEYRAAFGIEFVGLSLVDQAREAASLLGAELHDAALPKGLALLSSPAPLLRLYGAEPRPRLGAFDAALHQALFAAPPGAIGSVALLPLSRHGALIGSLHFGSADPRRYEADAGTHFLERLGAIAAVCLEGALNQERLKLAGLTDVLTGVHNRRYFEHRCPIEVAQARRHRHPLACLFLDIDRFKCINDSHGHQSGDEVLKAVGQRIHGQLRIGDTVARYGGEEFVVLLPQTPLQHAREIAERIRLCIAARAVTAASGEALAPTISIGLAMLPAEPSAAGPEEQAAALVAAADKALYRAKNEGRNRVVLSGDA